jgi:hypothetical protein
VLQGPEAIGGLGKGMPMKNPAFIAASVLAVVSGAAWGQEPKLAAEGRGLLPGPATMPTRFEGVAIARPFERDASGTLSRIVFESDEDPNFKVVIRDVSVPPDRQAHTLALPAQAMLQRRTGSAEFTIDKKRAELPTAIMTVSPSQSVELLNTADKNSVVRIYRFEAKPR